MNSSSDTHSPAFPGKTAILGSGTWATALAKLILANNRTIGWYVRRDSLIADFIATGRNTAYLSDVEFDVSRIRFSSDINEVCDEADTIIIAIPSPYFKDETDKITAGISGKNIVSAVKGIVPGDNVLITDYMQSRFGIAPDRCLVIGGPCHAEEVAMARPSYLTVACSDIDRAAVFAQTLSGKNTHTITSADVDGIEYAAVIKNVYAIASGIVHGLKMGDNFLAMLMSNAIREMASFVNTAVPVSRDICDSVYLGDLLITAYSRFSRNHYLGSMIGRGYSVKAARMEMEQTAEGYYAAKCIHDINERYEVAMPILNGVYDILYRKAKPDETVIRMAEYFD